MRNVVIVGSSGHAKVVIDIIEKEGKFHIVGLLDRFRSQKETTMGYPILGREEDLPELVTHHGIDGTVVAIGDNFIRSQVTDRIRKLCSDLEFITTIHPDANIGRDVVIREGCVIMAGVTINPCCEVGRFCILNTHSSLDHDSTIDDFASLAPGVVTGGNCRIGAFSAIGIGAALLQGIRIGEHSLVGAGATVTRSVEGYSVAYGTPAKFIRNREAGEKFL